MIEFPTVSQELRSLISRRKELHTFLGSVFAGLGILLQNVLQGSLPPGLADLESHIFCFYAVLLMVPSLILALRMARLHGGMVLNGVLYARLMQGQDFTRKGDPERAARHNVFGVSFLQFVLANFIAAFSAAVLALSLAATPLPAAATGAGVFLVWLALYFHFHRRAERFARAKMAAEPCAPFTREDWEAHISASLDDANHGLIADLGFTGLIIFSVFEVMTGLGQVRSDRLDLQADHVRLYGPQAYTLLMLVTCVLGLVTYLRVRVAIGRFSLDLDPTDRPFRPLTPTDSLLGYLLLAFFLAVAVHLCLIQIAPGLPSRTVLAADAASLAVALLAEQVTLVVAGRAYHGRHAPPSDGLVASLGKLPAGEPPTLRPEDRPQPDRPDAGSPTRKA